MYLNESLLKKWDAVLNHPDLPKISDIQRRSTVAALLENTEQAMESDNYEGVKPKSLLEAGIPASVTGSEIDNYDPVLISLVRRSMPNLMAYDWCGVQPMTGPTGLIFALRSRYVNQTGAEAFYNEANTAFATSVAGTNAIGQQHVGTYPGNSSTGTANLAGANLYNFGSGMATPNAEALGVANSTGGSDTPFPEMAFSIEKVTVTAKSRALKASYSLELAQDLRAIHGLDAETELSTILSTEIMAEINREILRTIIVTAQRGAASGTTTVGRFDLDTDANGRWSVEKYKGLMMQIEFEANQVAKGTRRGRANLIICSADVASALSMTGLVSNTPNLNNNNSMNMLVDDTGNTFVGVLNGKYRVYVDPYTTGNYAIVGYKGASAFDAGLFYCPYVPLQMLRAVGEDTFQPRIGFKTRYGMVANPFAEGATAGLGALTKDSNVYYRRILVDNLL